MPKASVTHIMIHQGSMNLRLTIVDPSITVTRVRALATVNDVAHGTGVVTPALQVQCHDHTPVSYKDLQDLAGALVSEYDVDVDPGGAPPATPRGRTESGTLLTRHVAQSAPSVLVKAK